MQVFQEKSGGHRTKLEHKPVVNQEEQCSYGERKTSRKGRKNKNNKGLGVESKEFKRFNKTQILKRLLN